MKPIMFASVLPSFQDCTLYKRLSLGLSQPPKASSAADNLFKLYEDGIVQNKHNWLLFPCALSASVLSKDLFINMIYRPLIKHRLQKKGHKKLCRSHVYFFIIACDV